VPNQDEQADPADDEHVSDVEDGPVVQVNESGPRLGALRLWRAPDRLTSPEARSGSHPIEARDPPGPPLIVEAARVPQPAERYPRAA
jgi:hypothetical protein